MKCQHFCVNTPNGGKCMCKSGYQLASDEVTCRGNMTVILKKKRKLVRCFFYKFPAIYSTA